MFPLSQFATRHAAAFEKIYLALSPSMLRVLARVKVGGRLEWLVTFVEKHIKKLFFGCQMCGDCVLFKTGMTCPMNCPKQMRNGPCGGVRSNGHCEIKPAMRCVWVEAWEGAARMQNGAAIQTIHFAVNAEKKGSSAWLSLARQSKVGGAGENVR